MYQRVVIFVSILAMVLSVGRLNAQSTQPNVIQAVRIPEPIHIDGNLNKAIWQNAIPVTNFTQREPAEGTQPSEQTKVAILYDQHNIYFGIWCYGAIRPGTVLASG